LDYLFDGAVSFVVGGFDFGHRGGSLERGAAKETVGERTADALVKEHEEQSNAGTFVSEAVGVALAVALQQSRGLSFCAVIREQLDLPVVAVLTADP
jgi:hypothetical protein